MSRFPNSIGPSRSQLARNSIAGADEGVVVGEGAGADAVEATAGDPATCSCGAAGMGELSMPAAACSGSGRGDLSASAMRSIGEGKESGLERDSSSLLVAAVLATAGAHAELNHSICRKKLVLSETTAKIGKLRSSSPI